MPNAQGTPCHAIRQIPIIQTPTQSISPESKFVTKGKGKSGEMYEMRKRKKSGEMLRLDSQTLLDPRLSQLLKLLRKTRALGEPLLPERLTSSTSLLVADTGLNDVLGTNAHVEDLRRGGLAELSALRLNAD